MEIGAREKDQGVDDAFLQSLGQGTQLMVVLILNLSVHENPPEACRNLNLVPPLEKLPIDNLEVREGFHVPGMVRRIQLRCLDGPLKGNDEINEGNHGEDATSSWAVWKGFSRGLGASFLRWRSQPAAN